MNGNSSAETLSVSIDDTRKLDTTRLLMLLGLGVIVVAVHQAFRFPMNLPGRHGLDTMFLMTMGMLMVGNRWSGTATGIGAGGSAWVIGGGALAPLLYPICGLVLAIAPRISVNWRRSLVVLPAIGALAWASRPLVRWIVAGTTGLEFESIAAGLLWPVTTHLVFGFIGSLGAILVWRGCTGASKR